MAIAADLFFIHVDEQKILRFGVAVGHAGIDVSKIVRERADIVKMVLRPARQMHATELAACPGDAERRLVGALTLDGVLKRAAEIHVVHQFGHRRHSLWPGREDREIRSGCILFSI